jgi:hypothetical protein
MLLSAAINASEVYIDQAGASTTIDILQQNGNNSIGTEQAPAIIKGDNILVDIAQDGGGNTATIDIDAGNDTVLDFSAVGSNNLFQLGISSAIGNQFDIDITGSSNAVSFCKDLACMDNMLVGGTDNTVSIFGDNNTVEFALDASDSVNVLTIGNSVASDSNTVRLTQSGNVAHTVNLTIEGSSNSVTLVQE